MTSTRGLGLAVLAVSALLARVPWGDVGLPLGTLPGVRLAPEWVVAAGPFPGWVGVGLESLLVWLLVCLALPSCTPSGRAH
ncbi:hypothetical protein [Salinigranum rubrum]|uniref:hypothetical protein n=1 Tax=Salinigranum rubrum TaxID=755307 RepID=UPI0013A54461|nr:hypothetical protein [Salinigranum rubrum]